MKASIVIRTYNEQKHLRELLQGIQSQICDGFEIETVIVDSGSTDNTLKIAEAFPTRIVPIKKEDFSFGRSLNVGCDAATGDVLVFVSGHCIPTGRRWVADLIAPLGSNGVVYTYGGQVGNEGSHFSECQIFGKYFPSTSKIPQEGFYCNNANAAMLKRVWQEHPFDEELTGLEDMHLAKRLVAEVGLGLAPGAAFGPEGDGWLRWCHAVSDPQKLLAGVDRLASFVARHRPG